MLSSQLKVSNFNKQNADNESKEVDPERKPSVSINLETNDDNPGDFERYSNDRKEALEKIKETEIKLEMEKTNLAQIISFQEAKIKELTQMALYTYNLLSKFK
jgi:hypothetical protein